jgi:hypothetical protein
MGLDDLPSDVWGILSECLIGKELIRLRNCGNKRIFKALTYGVSHLLFCHWAAPSCVSETILSFNNLRSLAIEVPANLNRPRKVWNLPVNFLDRLPTSLTELRLHFSDFGPDAYAHIPRGIIKLEMTLEDVSCLPTGLPEGLLSLKTCSIFLATSLDLLPNSLTHIDLQLVNLHDEHVSGLPRNLLYLRMPRVVSITDAGILELPQGLTTLMLPKAQGLTTACVEYLPRTLLHLALSSAKITPAAIKFLPPNLISMQLGDSFASSLRNEHVIHLPRSLSPISLRDCLSLSEVSIQDWPQKFYDDPWMFPLHLRRSLLNRYLDNFKGSHLLLPAWGEDALAAETFAHVPRHVFSIHWSGSSLYMSFVEHLPPQLEKLSLPNLRMFSDGALARLPRTLLTLNLGSQALTNDGLCGLPPGLTYLSLSNTPAVNDFGVSFLPPTLKTLLIPKAAELTDDGISRLPRGLTHLDIAWCKHISDSSIPLLPAQLVDLVLTSTTQITDAAIKMLPRTLQRVSLPRATLLTPACHEDFPPKCTASLPKGLIVVGIDKKSGGVV